MVQNFTLLPGSIYDERLGQSRNIFADRFAALDDIAWERTLVASLQTRVIDGVEFPPFPDEALQNRLHGTTGEPALHAAAEFYRWTRQRGLVGPRASWPKEAFFMDFGTGWGRILRQFMRDFPLSNMFGFEPNGTLAAVARGHNPYVSILSGAYHPPLALRDGLLHVITGLSIFSHLPLTLARAWFSEFARLLAPHGVAVLTTWGQRFLDRLRKEAEAARRGEAIHWYSQYCIERAGDLEARNAAYQRGEFVFISPNPDARYGEAFLSKALIARTIAEDDLPLVVEAYDDQSLDQDVFILRRLVD